MKHRTLQMYADDEAVRQMEVIAAHYRRSMSSAMRELVRAEYERISKAKRVTKLDLIGVDNADPAH